MSLSLRVLDSIAEVPPVAWDALVDAAAVPFHEHAWLEALEHSGCVGGRSGWQARHLTLWRGGELVAAAPAYEKEHSNGEFVYDWGWASAAERAGLAYYPKLVLAVPFTPATGRRVLVRQDEDRAAAEQAIVEGALALVRSERWGSLGVLFPTADEAARLGALGGSVRTGVQYHWKNRGYASFDDYLGAFSSKRRNQLRREVREVESRAMTITTRRGDALSVADADLIFRLYCSTVDKFMWGRRYLRKELFARLLERFRSRIELVEAKKDGQVIAGAFNVASPTHLFGRYWGCFEEHPFLHFGVCMYHSIAESIRLGRAQFEGGAGGDHKLQRGFEPSLTYSVHWMSDPRLAVAIDDFVRRERAEIDRRLPEWAAHTGLRQATT